MDIYVAQCKLGFTFVFKVLETKERFKRYKTLQLKICYFKGRGNKTGINFNFTTSGHNYTNQLFLQCLHAIGTAVWAVIKIPYT